jgi:hypothetical protein
VKRARKESKIRTKRVNPDLEVNKLPRLSNTRKAGKKKKKLPSLALKTPKKNTTSQKKTLKMAKLKDNLTIGRKSGCPLENQPNGF